METFSKLYNELSNDNNEVGMKIIKGKYLRKK